MSALVETAMYVRVPAWHKMGNVLPKAPTVEEGLVYAGLDWEVEPASVYATTDESVLMAPDYKALVRNTDKKILGIVGANYNILQNKEAFNWFDNLLQDGSAELDAAGSLREGKSIWVLAKMKQEAEIVEGDKVNQYILLSNTHDGTMAVWIQFTPIRVVCWNTLTASLSTRFEDQVNQKAIHIKHTAGLQERMKVAQEICDLSKMQFDRDTQAYKDMVKRECNMQRFQKYSGMVFEKEDIRQYREWYQLEKGFNTGLGMEIPGVAGTMWGAYNTITEFVDYNRGHDETRGNSMWFGEGKRIKQRAFTLATKFALNAA